MLAAHAVINVRAKTNLSIASWRSTTCRLGGHAEIDAVNVRDIYRQRGLGRAMIPRALGPGVGELALRPDQLAVIGRGDPLRPLDERDVLAHAQPVAARPVELALGVLELGLQALELSLASCRPGHRRTTRARGSALRDQAHGSTASNSAWTTSSTASAIAWPTRASAACENRALPTVPTSRIRADIPQLQHPASCAARTPVGVAPAVGRHPDVGERRELHDHLRGVLVTRFTSSSRSTPYCLPILLIA